MTRNTFITHLSPTESAELMQAARRRAMQLRRQAIDDTWQALASAVRHALHLESASGKSTQRTPYFLEA